VRGHVRRGELDELSGWEIPAYLSLAGHHPPRDVLNARSSVGARDNLTAYDAAYVALAEALQCPLVTGDARISRAPGMRCPVTVLPADRVLR
jgi:predicted nucleic acid-binding protein